MTACIEPERTLDVCSHDRCAEAQYYNSTRPRFRAQSCYVCHRVIADDCYVRVSFDGGVEDVCDTCVSRADEADPDDVPELLREGLPEFNGAFA